MTVNHEINCNSLLQLKPLFNNASDYTARLNEFMRASVQLHLISKLRTVDL